MSLYPAGPADVMEGRARVSVDLVQALVLLHRLPTASVDALITDPPYAEIDRAYGRLSEREWRALMYPLAREAQRVLKPRGSALYIVQPNSEVVGRMRTWVWEFMVWGARRIGMPQDLYWWNTAALPTVHASRTVGLLRPSVKPCVWLGPADCWRDQDAVLWQESQRNIAERAAARFDLDRRASGVHIRSGRASAVAAERGGVSPFNLLPIPNTASRTDAQGVIDQGAPTPYELADWAVRYLCPKGGIVLDPFIGSGTVGMAALVNGRRIIGGDFDPACVTRARAACLAVDADPHRLGELLGRPLAADPDADAGPLFARASVSNTPDTGRGPGDSDDR